MCGNDFTQAWLAKHLWIEIEWISGKAELEGTAGSVKASLSCEFRALQIPKHPLFTTVVGNRDQKTAKAKEYLRAAAKQHMRGRILVQYARALWHELRPPLRSFAAGLLVLKG